MKALKNYIASMKKRLELYHHLRVLLMESEEDNATVCKHAHLVKMTTTTTCESHHIQSRAACTSLPYFTNLLGDDVKDVELSKLRLTVQCKLDELNVLAAKYEQADALKTASQHVTSAIIGRIGAQLTTLPKKRKYPLNKNAEKQLRFFSTKKKRQLLK